MQQWPPKLPSFPPGKNRAAVRRWWSYYLKMRAGGGPTPSFLSSLLFLRPSLGGFLSNYIGGSLVFSLEKGKKPLRQSYLRISRCARRKPLKINANIRYVQGEVRCKIFCVFIWLLACALMTHCVVVCLHDVQLLLLVRWFPKKHDPTKYHSILLSSSKCLKGEGKCIGCVRVEYLIGITRLHSIFFPGFFFVSASWRWIWGWVMSGVLGGEGGIGRCLMTHLHDRGGGEGKELLTLRVEIARRGRNSPNPTVITKNTLKVSWK